MRLALRLVLATIASVAIVAIGSVLSIIGCLIGDRIDDARWRYYERRARAAQ